MRSSEVDYRATIDDPRITEVRILRPQEIPRLRGRRHVRPRHHRPGLGRGTWGRRGLARPAALFEVHGQSHQGGAGRAPGRTGLVGGRTGGLPPVRRGCLRVSTEYPELTRRFLDDHHVKADVSLSYGATEAKVPDIADCVVEITETGRALRAAGLKIIETLLVSHTELIANRESAEDPTKRHAMEQLRTLLVGVLEAREDVLVKLNVAADALDAVIEVLPSLRAPTVSELFGGGGFAVEAVVSKSKINVLIPALKDRGATDIIELALSKIVH